MSFAAATTGRVSKLLPAAVVLAVAAPGSLFLHHTGVAGAQGQKISACSLLTKEEVKTLSPSPPHLEHLGLEEDPLPDGSGCSYPTAYIQVLSMPQSGWKRLLDGLGQNATLESIAGIGDEAYIRDNKQMWAELAAKVGPHVLTIQESLKEGETTEAAKPRVIALAKAIVAKLR